jgi:hypothetical protein
VNKLNQSHKDLLSDFITDALGYDLSFCEMTALKEIRDTKNVIKLSKFIHDGHAEVVSILSDVIANSDRALWDGVQEFVRNAYECSFQWLRLKASQIDHYRNGEVLTFPTKKQATRYGEMKDALATEFRPHTIEGKTVAVWPVHGNSWGRLIGITVKDPELGRFGRFFSRYQLEAMGA